MRFILSIGILFLSCDIFAMNLMLTSERLVGKNVEPQQLFSDVALNIKKFFEKEKLSNYF